MCRQGLPDVYNEMETATFDGMPIFVKNTFIDIKVVEPRPAWHQRCRSVPSKMSFSDEEYYTPQATPQESEPDATTPRQQRASPSSKDKPCADHDSLVKLPDFSSSACSVACSPEGACPSRPRSPDDDVFSTVSTLLFEHPEDPLLGDTSAMEPFNLTSRSVASVATEDMMSPSELKNEFKLNSLPLFRLRQELNSLNSTTSTLHPSACDELPRRGLSSLNSTGTTWRDDLPSARTERAHVLLGALSSTGSMWPEDQPNSLNSTTCTMPSSALGEQQARGLSSLNSTGSTWREELAYMCEYTPPSCMTTVMIRSLPRGFNRTHLEEVLYREGFAACYDFIYIPSDIASGNSFHYAFVNFVSPAQALRIQRHFAGFTSWPAPFRAEDTPCKVDWSEALQGLGSLIERYRNSPLMHHSVPDGLRPAIYHQGLRAVFPPPTMSVRAPRVRRASPRRRFAGSSWSDPSSSP